MILTERVYVQLLHSPKVPPETGGLLGSHNGVIDTVCFDQSSGVTDRAVYIPNTEYLNVQLSRWQRAGVTFSGIFHSHPANEVSLSGEDMRYIQEIMMAMPQSICELYFPVVLPGQGILAFRAFRQRCQIYIARDEMKVMDRKER